MLSTNLPGNTDDLSPEEVKGAIETGAFNATLLLKKLTLRLMRRR